MKHVEGRSHITLIESVPLKHINVQEISIMQGFGRETKIALRLRYKLTRLQLCLTSDSSV